MEEETGHDFKFPPNYHTVQELNNSIEELCNQHSDLMVRYKLGESAGKNDIWCCIVSSEKNELQSKPASLIIGGHHGRECIGSEALYYTINYLLNNYSSNAQIRTWIDQSAILLIPLLNPDGHDIIERKNANGVDLNRNYTFNWGNDGASHEPSSEIYCGPNPLSESETQVANQMKIFDDLFIEYKNIKSTLDIHSGTEIILHPWGHTKDPAPDYDVFKKLCQQMEKKSQEMRVQFFEHIPAISLYPVAGDYMDHIYQLYHCISFVVEIYYRKWANDIFEFFNPPSEQVEAVCKRAFPIISTIIEFAAKS